MRLKDYPPMLLEERPMDFAALGWIYGIKFDGYRISALVDRGRVELRTRGGADATQWFPETCEALSALPGGPHVLDGEICVLDSLGRSDFDSLHQRARSGRWHTGTPVVTLMIFDLLVKNGLDITALPLASRKLRLSNVTSTAPAGVVTLDYTEEGKRLYDEAVLALRLEGLVAKRLESAYYPGARCADWVKVKRRGGNPTTRSRRGKIV